MTEPQSGATAAIQTPTSASSPVPRSRSGESWLRFAVLALMLVTILALFQYPLRRIYSDSEVNFNEGWNAYRQAFAQQGIQLYDAPPEVLTGSTNYPPLSFHLISILSFHGDVVRTGRWFSFIALLVTGVFIALIVGELGADPIIAAFSMLLYILGVAVFLPDRLGMDDPQLLAEAFTTAGLYLYVRARNNLVLLCSSALAFCLAGFTKQNLIAFPAAVAVDLLIHSRKRFAIWAAEMVSFALLLLGLTFAIDGRYFFDHLLTHRAYSLDAGLGSITHFYLLTFQSVMLIALVWTLCRFRSQPLLALAFVFSNGLAFVLAGGDGVDLNIYFNAFAAAAMVCGVALAEVESSALTEKNSRSLTLSRTSNEWEFGLNRLREKLVLALMAALFLCVAIRVPDRLREAHLRGAMMADDDAGFRAAVDLVKSTPGPALCESLLVCYRAGKPYIYDTYSAIEEIKSHHTDIDASIPLLRSRHFAVIQLDALPGEAVTEPPTIFRTRSRFTLQFVDTLLEYYRPELRTAHYLVFVPK
jgi:hypothetical protein